MLQNNIHSVLASKTKDNTTTKDKGIAELTVKILSQEWPLPLKALHWRIKREHGKEVTQQAIHKALKKLVEQGIVVKNSKYYQLNTGWLDQLIEFGKETKQAYKSKEKPGTGFLENGWQIFSKNSVKNH